MQKFLFLCFLSIATQGITQEYSPTYNISRQDLTNNYFEKDSTANAVIIYDYGNTFYNKETWFLNVEKKRKIKILTNDGRDYGEVVIPLYQNKNSKETVKDIVATTYNLENDEIVISKMNKSSIYREQKGNWTLVKLVLPNVKAGSVISYSYKKATKFINKYEPWYFQHDIPTVYSEYNVSIPGNYEYHIKLVGNIPLKTNASWIEHNCLEAGRGASADCAVYKYVMTDIPAYKQEDFTTTKENYLSRIEYELSVVKHFDGKVDKVAKTWADVDDELNADKDFGRQIKKTSIVKKLLPETIKDISDRKAKATAIYQYVLDNYKWNNDYGRFDVSIKRLLEEKGGNAFELNLLLHNLLATEDFEVSPLLISTRNNGFATKIYPVLSDFNYVILKLKLDSDTYYLDATSPYLSFGEIPYRCLNKYGRVIDFKNGSYWEDITPKSYSTSQIRALYSVNENNELVGTVNKIVSGYKSHDKKQSYFENSTQYLETIKSEYSFSELYNHKVLSESRNDIEFSEEFEIIHEEGFIGDNIFFNPFIHRFINENPFKLQQRSYPIDFGYMQTYEYSLQIDLGEKLKIGELPENQNIALPDNLGSLIFSTTSNNDEVTLYFKIKFDSPIYNFNYYGALKVFLSKVIDIQNNTLISLKKI